jgi:hypothetical protein
MSRRNPEKTETGGILVGDRGGRRHDLVPRCKQVAGRPPEATTPWAYGSSYDRNGDARSCSAGRELGPDIQLGKDEQARLQGCQQLVHQLGQVVRQVVRRVHGELARQRRGRWAEMSVDQLTVRSHPSKSHQHGLCLAPFADRSGVEPDQRACQVPARTSPLQQPCSGTLSGEQHRSQALLEDTRDRREPDSCPDKGTV